MNELVFEAERKLWGEFHKNLSAKEDELIRKLICVYEENYEGTLEDSEDRILILLNSLTEIVPKLKAVRVLKSTGITE